MTDWTMIMLPYRAVVVALGAAVLLALVACSGSRSPVAPMSPESNDPILEGAAALIQPTLENSYADTYAGLKIDNAAHQVIVYRRSDPDLDSMVRATATHASVTFRDARYSLAEMREFGDEVLRDRDYWSIKGLTINGMMPRYDGSGIDVLATEDGKQLETALTEHYGSMPIALRKQTVMFPQWTGPAIPPMGSAPTPS